MRVFLDPISPSCVHPPDVAAAVMQFQQSVSRTTKRRVVPSLAHTHTPIFSRQILESDRPYIRVRRYVIDPTVSPSLLRRVHSSSLLIALCLQMWAVQTLTLSRSHAHTSAGCARA